MRFDPARQLGEGQLNKFLERLITSLKRTTPVSALRHAARIATIVAKASFWAVCYHYFGSKALLYVAASWMFMLGVKDLTFARVRLSTLKDPVKRRAAFAKSVTADLMMVALRLAVIFGLGAILVPFNRDVAAIVSAMAICAGLWARETFIAAASVYRVGSIRTYVAFVAVAASIASIIYFAENNLDPIRSAIWALLIREGVTFFGFAAVAVIGALGVRLATDDMAEDDDDDGGDAEPILAPDGREIRSAWKILIADNVVYSRWRMMHFATRFVAHGILGPFGGVATRIAFSYRKPLPYKHHGGRISTGRIIAFALAAAVTVSTIIFFAQQAGLLRALGIVLAAFLFRLAAMSLNLLFWRQLSPIVGKRKKPRQSIDSE